MATQRKSKKRKSLVLRIRKSRDWLCYLVDTSDKVTSYMGEGEIPRILKEVESWLKER